MISPCSVLLNLLALTLFHISPELLKTTNGKDNILCKRHVDIRPVQHHFLQEIHLYRPSNLRWVNLSVIDFFVVKFYGLNDVRLNYDVVFFFAVMCATTLLSAVIENLPQISHHTTVSITLKLLVYFDSSRKDDAHFSCV